MAGTRRFAFGDANAKKRSRSSASAEPPKAAAGADATTTTTTTRAGRRVSQVDYTAFYPPADDEQAASPQPKKRAVEGAARHGSPEHAASGSSVVEVSPPPKKAVEQQKSQASHKSSHDSADKIGSTSKKATPSALQYGSSSHGRSLPIDSTRGVPSAVLSSTPASRPRPRPFVKSSRDAPSKTAGSSSHGRSLPSASTRGVPFSSIPELPRRHHSKRKDLSSSSRKSKTFTGDDALWIGSKRAPRPELPDGPALFRDLPDVKAAREKREREAAEKAGKAGADTGTTSGAQASRAAASKDGEDGAGKGSSKEDKNVKAPSKAEKNVKTPSKASLSPLTHASTSATTLTRSGRRTSSVNYANFIAQDSDDDVYEDEASTSAAVSKTRGKKSAASTSASGKTSGKKAVASTTSKASSSKGKATSEDDDAYESESESEDDDEDDDDDDEVDIDEIAEEAEEEDDDNKIAPDELLQSRAVVEKVINDLDLGDVLLDGSHTKSYILNEVHNRTCDTTPEHVSFSLNQVKGRKGSTASFEKVVEISLGVMREFISRAISKYGEAAAERLKEFDATRERTKELVLTHATESLRRLVSLSQEGKSLAFTLEEIKKLGPISLRPDDLAGPLIYALYTFVEQDEHKGKDELDFLRECEQNPHTIQTAPHFYVGMSEDGFSRAGGHDRERKSKLPPRSYKDLVVRSMVATFMDPLIRVPKEDVSREELVKDLHLLEGLVSVMVGAEAHSAQLKALRKEAGLGHPACEDINTQCCVEVSGTRGAKKSGFVSMNPTLPQLWRAHCIAIIDCSVRMHELQLLKAADASDEDILEAANELALKARTTARAAAEAYMEERARLFREEGHGAKAKFFSRPGFKSAYRVDALSNKVFTTDTIDAVRDEGLAHNDASSDDVDMTLKIEELKRGSDDFGAHLPERLRVLMEGIKVSVIDPTGKIPPHYLYANENGTPIYVAGGIPKTLMKALHLLPKASREARLERHRQWPVKTKDDFGGKEYLAHFANGELRLNLGGAPDLRKGRIFGSVKQRRRLGVRSINFTFDSVPDAARTASIAWIGANHDALPKGEMYFGDRYDKQGRSVGSMPFRVEFCTPDMPMTPVMCHRPSNAHASNYPRNLLNFLGEYADAAGLAPIDDPSVPPCKIAASSGKLALAEDEPSMAYQERPIWVSDDSRHGTSINVFYDKDVDKYIAPDVRKANLDPVRTIRLGKDTQRRLAVKEGDRVLLRFFFWHIDKPEEFYCAWARCDGNGTPISDFFCQLLPEHLSASLQQYKQSVITARTEHANLFIRNAYHADTPHWPVDTPLQHLLEDEPVAFGRQLTQIARRGPHASVNCSILYDDNSPMPEAHRPTTKPHRAGRSNTFGCFVSKGAVATLDFTFGKNVIARPRYWDIDDSDDYHVLVCLRDENDNPASPWVRCTLPPEVRRAIHAFKLGHV